MFEKLKKDCLQIIRMTSFFPKKLMRRFTSVVFSYFDFRPRNITCAKIVFCDILLQVAKVQKKLYHDAKECWLKTMKCHRPAHFHQVQMKPKYSFMNIYSKNMYDDCFWKVYNKCCIFKCLFTKNQVLRTLSVILIQYANEVFFKNCLINAKLKQFVIVTIWKQLTWVLIIFF